MTNEWPPQRLAVSPDHPWFDPYWVPRVRVMLGGVSITGVTIADGIEGWVELYLQPHQIDGDGELRRIKARGEVKIVPSEFEEGRKPS